MANIWTVSNAAANGGKDISVLSNLIVPAYDRNFRLALRTIPTFRMFADVKPVNITNPGDSITFTIYKDLPPATAPLDEVIDPDSIGLPNPDRINVTLKEYGNLVIDTHRLEVFSLDQGLASRVGNIVAYNMVDSIDLLIQNVLEAGISQVIREAAGVLSTTAARNTITKTDTIKTRDIRFMVTKFRAMKVIPTVGNDYNVMLHPEVSADLRAESGPGGWRNPREYVDPSRIYAGTIGEYEGAQFVESPRCFNLQDGSGTGATQTRVYRTYAFGVESLAEAVADEFHIVTNSVIPDAFLRKNPVGWYGIAGWGCFRPQALWRLETASSLRPDA